MMMSLVISLLWLLPPWLQDLLFGRAEPIA